MKNKKLYALPPINTIIQEMETKSEINLDNVEKTLSLISRHQIGDKVDIVFDKNQILTNWEVIQVKFTDYGKVFYSVKNTLIETKIHNVDSVFVMPKKTE